MWSTSSDTRAPEPRVEPRRLGVAVRLEPRQARLDHLALGERPLADALEEGGVPLPDEADHRLDHRAGLGGRVARAHHPVQAVQDDARDACGPSR